MYKLFTKRFENQHARIEPPAFELIQRTYHREIAKIIDYYRSRVYAVSSQHLLCRMLITGSISSSAPVDRFMEIAYARSPYVAKYFNLTSEISYGRLFNGVFYGPGNSEIILYNEDYFDPYDGLENWESLEPVKVLEHPISDFTLMPPNGKRNSSAEGLCVISINLPMLLLQYRGFLNRRNSVTGLTGGGLGETHFVNMYVLPGMLKSHSELIILNRMKNLFYGAPMSISIDQLPFYVTDYGRRLDKSLEYVLGHLKDTNRPYAQYLQNIPSFYEKHMQEVLLMPDFARTRQVWWSLLMTRLSTIKFLIDLGGDNGVTSNGNYISKLKLDIKQLNRENLMQSVLPKDMYYDVKVTLDSMLEL